MFTRADRKTLRSIEAKVDALLEGSATTPEAKDALLHFLTDLETHFEEEHELMASVEALRTEVSELTTVVDSATAAINGLKQQVADALSSAGVDQATIDEITSQIDAQTNRLALAIANKTDAADEVHAAGM